MSSSSHNKIQRYSMVPQGSSTTSRMKTSWSMEDAMRKLTITNETTHKNKLVTDHKGRVGLKQEVVNRTTETVKNRCKGTVKEVTYEVVTKKALALGKEDEHKSHGRHHHHHGHHSHEVVKYGSKDKYYRSAK